MTLDLKLIDRLPQLCQKSYGGVSDGIAPQLIKDLSQSGKDVLIVARDEANLTSLEIALKHLTTGITVLSFPSWGTLPFERVSPNRATLALRAHSLSFLAQRSTDMPVILITTAASFLQKIPPRQAMTGKFIKLIAGQSYNYATLPEQITALGYSRCDNVFEPGTFCVRGDILDLFPPTEPDPLRIDFFDNEIESIKPFDPTTQLSDAQGISSLCLCALKEILLSSDQIKCFREAYRAHTPYDLKSDTLYQGVSVGQLEPGAENFLPLFLDHLESINDYLKDPKIIFTPGYIEGMRF